MSSSKMECNLPSMKPELLLQSDKNVKALDFFIHNDMLMATGLVNNDVELWDLRGDVTTYSLEGHHAEVTDVKFSLSGHLLASSSKDKSVIIWEVLKRQRKYSFATHLEPVRSVQFSPNDMQIITASDDRSIHIYSHEKRKLACRLAGHKDHVLCAMMSDDSTQIASCSVDQNIRFWDANTTKCIYRYEYLSGYGNNLAWLPGTKFLGVGTSLGKLKLFDTRTHNTAQFYSLHTAPITQLAFHPKKKYIVTASKDGTLKVVDLNMGKPLYSLDSTSNAAKNAVSYSKSGAFIAAATSDRLVAIWKT
ncbi:POC1 centriolar protein homolog A-like [Pararge aegeria]|uniref:POC1 centriolar protein homolog A-like n=1 Tax=Pararge aegeria TaxID=116150 RepID=UPI0019CFD7E0|nr:POC1 centriolar protein homolog A-like [Pararge aegeria]